ncbi:MAG: hypothetical protein JST69_12560 [Bacteroidetes bacterium]|nr:hypothetical protein [Bacteroidota bacterium]
MKIFLNPIQILIFLAGSFMPLAGFAQSYVAFKNTFSDLVQLSTIPDSAQRTQAVSKRISDLRARHQIPYIEEDSVLFLYQGPARSVNWVGDFNGWGYDKNFQNKGTPITGTELWYLKTSFPKDARLDYKVLRNGSEYLLDPENAAQQWSGLGGGSPNSELRMPLWKENPETIPHAEILKGTLTQDIIFNSQTLGYQITYKVYLPAGYETLGKIDCIYVTDGYEYLHPKLGNMETILNNVIAEKKIRSVMAVFVDHREPVNRANNKRMQELAMNKSYLDFFVNELIPDVEKNYPARATAANRAILGTSMGGLTAAYFAFERPDVFSMAGIQSPAFYTKPQIYQLCSNPASPKMKISMTSGVINDTGKEARKMKDILAANSCVYHYREVNEGHSWGNWRNLISTILIDLFAPQ